MTSGRTGSTLLARFLREHADLVCISDLFEPVGQLTYLDAGHLVSGKEFFAELTRRSLPERIRYWRSRPTDELLHLPADDDAVSLLLAYTLPFLARSDPTALLRELRQVVCGFEPAPMPHQLIRTFDWLRDRFNGARWVERTGGSLPHAAQLIETFPDAKFIHLVRDTREVAISMMRGSFFRLYLEMTRDPDLTTWDWDVDPDVAELGAMVTQWEVAAVKSFASLPPDRHLLVRYEDLLARPERILTTVVEYLLDRPHTHLDRRWARQQAAAIVAPRLRFASLPTEQQRSLQQACDPALRLLGYRD